MRPSTCDASEDERVGGETDAAAACADGRTDAEVRAAAKTPTEIGGGDLARADQETVRLYHELKARHDDLVEWVDMNVNCGL